MRKNLSFLLPAFLLLVATDVWGAKVTTVSGIQDGARYYIGATNSSTDYYLQMPEASGDKGTAVTNSANATVFIFEETETANTYKIKIADTDNYIQQLGNAKSYNGCLSFGESNAAEFYASDQSNDKIRLANNNRSIQKNTSNTYWGSYGNTQTDIWLLPASSYTITAAVNNALWGSANVVGATITASPNSGYRVITGNGGYTVNSGTATVVNNGDNTFTVTPSSDCTVQINFEAIPTYTVTLNDNHATITETLGGAGVTLPSRSSLGEYTFAGWSTENISLETTTKPTNISTASTYYPTANTTLYPVYYRTAAGADPTAFSVGSTGDYVIVSAPINEKYYALPTNPTVNSGKITAEEITVSEVKGVKCVTSANAEGFVWTIEGDENDYTISDGSKYIYHSNGGSSGTNLAYGTGTTYTWSFTADGDYIKMYGRTSSTVGGRGLLFSGTTIGGYSLGNWDNSGYYKSMILPVYSSVKYYYSTPAAPVSVSDAGWASLYLPFNAAIPSGLNAYYARATTNSSVTLTKIEGNKVIPAEFGVIVNGSVGNYEFEYSSADPAVDKANVTNKFGGVIESTLVENIDPGDDNSLYVLGKENGVVGFYLPGGELTSLAPYKAYLIAPSQLTTAPAIHFIIENGNGATNINAIDATDEAVKFIQDGKLYIKKNGVVYDLLGTVVR